MKFVLKFTLWNRLYFGKIPAKIPAKNKIPAGTGTKSPNPGRDPGCTGIPVELCQAQQAITKDLNLQMRKVAVKVYVYSESSPAICCLKIRQTCSADDWQYAEYNQLLGGIWGIDFWRNVMVLFHIIQCLVNNIRMQQKFKYSWNTYLHWSIKLKRVVEFER